jgi:hypothetical protein
MIRFFYVGALLVLVQKLDLESVRANSTAGNDVSDWNCKAAGVVANL